MKRLKIIDIPKYETNTRTIAQQLAAALEDIRKKKLARDLIGEDERCSEFEVDDFDLFADELSDGIELTIVDHNRISERAGKLAKARVNAAGVSHLKREEYERLEPSLDGMMAVMPRGENWADEIAAALHEDMPWMARATEYVWHEMRRAAKRDAPITIRPVILNGPPGIGKSVWARAVAKAIRVPMADVDASKGGAGLALVGLERGWSSAQSGRPVDLMLAKRIANPLIVVDEICKAKTTTSFQGTNHRFSDALLSLVEPATAKSWECPFFRVRLDMSHISWVMTSNTISAVPEPLRNRCQTIEIPDVTTEQLQSFAAKKAGAAGLSEDALAAVVEAIAQVPLLTGRRLSLRDVVRMLERAEALEGRPRLQ